MREIVRFAKPEASDEEAVFEYNRAATLAAIEMGRAGGPDRSALADLDVPENPFFRQS